MLIVGQGPLSTGLGSVGVFECHSNHVDQESYSCNC